MEVERPHYYWQIQVVKTFIIPIFLYGASMMCLYKEFLNEANKIIFDLSSDACGRASSI